MAGASNTQRLPWPGPLAPLEPLLGHAELVMQLTRQRIRTRYRGSLLGITWMVLSPLLTLAIFTLVFGVMFGSRWSDEENTLQYALLLYLGLCVFWFVGESVSDATGVIADHASYVKKVVFPLAVLPWAIVMTALFHIVVRIAIFVVAWVALQGVPPPTLLALPLVFVPVVFATLGLAYFVACLGTFVRDLREVTALLLTALMFLSPILYPLSAVPEAVRPWMSLNPLTGAVQALRNVAAFGVMPDAGAFVLGVLGSFAFAWLGAAFFERLRRVFADVV